ncbi:uncharacterized protein LOC124662602 [Lolium rigidum]|uniref:uncharacterized protein LOC124662602 n=1 Tax=Lolium rigidum TaxID=89674 RepID=UPI001F5C20DB|nr:uncharacterized protein LOC124662602 [Lolium rigidum]
MSALEPDLGAMVTGPVNKKVRALGTEGWSKWSLLQDDLVRRIADSFLASNDLDHYMCLRAVCPSWRSATDDPKDNASDPVFHPLRWIILDEVFQGDDDMRILLNTHTGRFLHKKLPLLREYYVVATTPSGFFVLAEKTRPHRARVFNPLTGCLTCFPWPVPLEAGVAQVGRDDGLFCLYFLGGSSHKFYTAVPEIESVFSRDCQQEVYSTFRDVVLPGAYPQYISAPALAAAFDALSDLLSSHSDFVKFLSSDLPEDDVNNIRFRCYVVGLAAQVFLHVEMQGRTPIVFKVNTKIGKFEPVESIGTFTIFIGYHRCLTVDADKFPAIEANCVYYTQHSGSSAHICKYNLSDKKVERFSEVAEFVKQDKQFVLVAARPFTIIQLLCSYTINRRDSELALQQMVQGAEQSCSNFVDG